MTASVIPARPGSDYILTPRDRARDVLTGLAPGDTLWLADGTLSDLIGVTVPAGTREQPIAVRALPGRQPVIHDGIRLTGCDWWQFSGLRVTQSQVVELAHMVKLRGSYWLLEDCELDNAHAQSALMIGNGARGWRVRRCRVHHTHAVSGINQDHLVYVSDAEDGIIERCQLWHALNGRGVKLGRGSDVGDDLPRRIVIRDTTIADTAAGSIGLSFGARDNLARRCRFSNPYWPERTDDRTRYPAVYGYRLRGTGNRVERCIVEGTETIASPEIEVRDSRIGEPLVERA